MLLPLKKQVETRKRQKRLEKKLLKCVRGEGCLRWHYPLGYTVLYEFIHV